MTSERAIAMFGLGALLFGYPAMAVMSQGGFVAGVPLLYGYLFLAWAGFVGALAWLAERARPGDAAAARHSTDRARAGGADRPEEAHPERR